MLIFATIVFVCNFLDLVNITVHNRILLGVMGLEPLDFPLQECFRLLQGVEPNRNLSPPVAPAVPKPLPVESPTMPPVASLREESNGTI